MSDESVSFSFGENWQHYLKGLSPRAIDAQTRYLRDWFPEGLDGKTVLDIGSGSGLTSLIAWRSGAAVTSFDADPASVNATRHLWEVGGRPANWQVLQGSILDPGFTRTLGTFETVIAWGVLHHTGAMWQAIENASQLVADGGLLWIAIYRRGPRYGFDLRLKRAYNRLPSFGKLLMRTTFAAAWIARRLLRGDVTLSRLRHYGDERGMSWRRDIEDWLGGLPYEVASPAEIHSFLYARRFVLERLDAGQGDGGNDVYRFRRTRRA